jgi:hypothetical protein
MNKSIYRLIVIVILMLTIGVPNAQAAPLNAITSSITTTFTPSADAFVQDSAPDTNFGSLTQIRVDNSPIIRSYLRFDVKGLTEPVTKAVLRLYTQSVSNIGYNVYLSPDTGWDENNINYTNAPALGGQAGSVGAFGADVWTTMDITSFVTGNGTLSLAISGANNSSINFVSREGGTNAPQLMITTGSGNVVVPTVGPSATTVPTQILTFTSTPTTINTSVPTAINTLVTALATTTTTFKPSGDAFVHATSANTNFGSLTQLRLDNSPIIRSYLRFNVQGLSGPVTKATLRLYTQSVSNVGYNVYFSPDTGWGETTINYTNAPALGGLAGSVDAFSTNIWTTVDITPFITGNGTLNLAITGKNDSSVNFVSREGGANAPQLVIITGGNIIVPTVGPSATTVPTKVATSIPPTATRIPPTATTVNTIIPPTATPTVPVPTGGKVWYVDNVVSTNGDGTSWARAWKGLSSIQWSLVQPGHTIYLSGGSSSKIYNEQLAVSNSGTSSARITIAGGRDDGHNGQVILDGGETRSYCARTSGNYLTLSGLTCQNSISSGIRIEGTGTILENSIFSSISGQAIHLAGCDDCIVRGNKITTDDINASQTDGVVVYGNSQGVVIESNWIKLTNQTGSHNDGVQANQDTDLTVRYNYIENTKNSTSDAQGIYATQMYGTIKFYGNVVVVPYGGQSVTNRNLDIGTSHTIIANNTIKCGGYRCIYVSEDTLPVIKNNLVWQTGASDVLQIADSYSRGVSLANIPDANIDGNLWYAPNGDGKIFDVFGQKNWNSWQTEGFDAHGKITDPGVDSCFRPITSSPAINAGQVLTNEYSSGLAMSFCGTNTSTGLLTVILTDRGTAWNIGAYDTK